ncbi:hypothetical protein BWK59_04965 [Flavobacterium davisii]|uniref:Secretion system C-terminal sorting domain-containing protein n=1 Tax=Flavobacterium davisii TaxID=2906077 RepID=A0A246GJN4_9FLAO|nr:T9SS type A sorting domain-containing protein [Flavobacterium davisii]OWP84502.1 hypothetical protein BWK59_04965 [Flavobacterium davisii]
MRGFFGIVLLLFVVNGYGQQVTKLLFEYDAAGNQIKRYICVNCVTSAREAVKPVEQVKATDLQEVPEIEQLTYYPNPVHEQLYFKWQNAGESVIVSMHVVSISGQILREFWSLNQKNDLLIDFSTMPSGMYVIMVRYSNGSEKSVKVVKE